MKYTAIVSLTFKFVFDRDSNAISLWKLGKEEKKLKIQYIKEIFNSFVLNKTTKMSQTSLKINALNPVIISKSALILKQISEFDGIASVVLNNEDAYSFTFTVTVESESVTSAHIEKIRELLKFHASAILTINKL